MKPVSVIVRTKNESKYLDELLMILTKQTIPNEIIIIDNESTDNTLEIAKKYNCIITHITDDEFNYSLALNRGIELASNRYVAIISGHCIPTNEYWLENFKKEFEPIPFLHICGTYGRQIPAKNSRARDKRDLLTTFGNQRIIQHDNFFFHNANSMIDKEVWNIIKFDESSNGLEDRKWAKDVLAEKGWLISYTPDAIVTHEHGINQDNDKYRLERVVSIMEDLYRGDY